MSAVTQTLVGAQSDPYDSSRYRYYALGLMTAGYTLSFLDRQILAILQEPIKSEFGLTDGQLGLLTGFTFALFYVVLGLPIARWADRGVRRDIMALAIGIWSVMTALCGLAQHYLHLLLARVGVGIGEAGGSPPAYSMVSDIFPPRQRATALGVYSIGVNLGILAGFLIGGWVNQLFGWRVAFLAAGIPGILLAVLVRVTVAEPLRRHSAVQTLGAEEQPPVAEVLRQLWSYRTFRHMVWGASLMSFAGYSTFNWLPSLLIRTHGLSTGTIGTWLAMSIGIGGAVGTIGGSYLADRLGQRDKRWYAWITVLGYTIAMPLLIGTLLAANGRTALLCFVVPGSVLAMCTPALIAVTHSLVGNRMRALSAAVVLFVLNVFGLGLGPLAVGVLSDHLTPAYGIDGLRYAMLMLVTPAAAWGMIHFLLAARHIKAEWTAAN